MVALTHSPDGGPRALRGARCCSRGTHITGCTSLDRVARNSDIVMNTGFTNATQIILCSGTTSFQLSRAQAAVSSSVEAESPLERHRPAPGKLVQRMRTAQPVLPHINADDFIVSFRCTRIIVAYMTWFCTTVEACAVSTSVASRWLELYVVAARHMALFQLFSVTPQRPDERRRQQLRRQPTRRDEQIS